jgi:RNA polymerase-binding transcription factor DksA
MGKLQQRLESMLARLQGDIHFLTGEVKSIPTAGSTEPHDTAADDLYHADQMLLSNEANIGEEIQAALERLGKGTFGDCEGCGQPIAEERLEAIPYARMCIACASK